jgi:hypothetical protein
MDLSSQIQDNTTRSGTLSKSTVLRSVDIYPVDKQFCQQNQMGNNSLLDRRLKWIRLSLPGNSILASNPRLVLQELMSNNTSLPDNPGNQKLLLFLLISCKFQSDMLS